MRNIPLAGIELTSQRVRGYMVTSELPGRPANIILNTSDITVTDTFEEDVYGVYFAV